MSLKIKASPGIPDNAIHRDLEEALKFVPIDFMLNVIVNHDQQVLHAVAGHIVDAHREGVSVAARRFVIPVNKKYDVVVVSPGGHPKDLQLYQALKALRNAASFAKPGGTLLLAAECSEMLGNGVFQFWVDTMPDLDRMVSKLQENFVIGAHKILHIDEVLRKHHVYLYSSLPKYLAELLGFHHAQDIEITVASLLNRPDLSLAIMPFGALTFAKA